MQDSSTLGLDRFSHDLEPNVEGSDIPALSSKVTAGTIEFRSEPMFASSPPKEQTSMSFQDRDREEPAKPANEWWLRMDVTQKADSAAKWTTLPITLAPAVEEMATLFAASLGTPNAENPVLQKNFFKDFSNIAKTHKTRSEMNRFDLCDFGTIRNYLQSAERSNMVKKEQKSDRKKKAILDKVFEVCRLDGRIEKVGNHRTESLDIFVGRGDNPLNGKLKGSGADRKTGYDPVTVFVRQRAPAMWLLDHLAFKAGNEKGEDGADTVGCCSLRFEHVTLKTLNTLHLDFMGSDSIEFKRTIQVSDQVYKRITAFKKRFKPSEINKLLQGKMDRLTAEVVRTYNASSTFHDLLEKYTLNDGTVAEKKLAFDRANREVTIRTHKYQKMKLKNTILVLESKLKKKSSALSEPESDLEVSWKHEAQLMDKEQERDRITA
ncbi:DNA topoisomerase 1 [Mortierella sp. GBA35]|nr:DNA topoisomerase 1 [Mortierella sp. GBA35]